MAMTVDPLPGQICQGDISGLLYRVDSIVPKAQVSYTIMNGDGLIEGRKATVDWGHFKRMWTLENGSKSQQAKQVHPKVGEVWQYGANGKPCLILEDLGLSPYQQEYPGSHIWHIRYLHMPESCGQRQLIVNPPWQRIGEARAPQECF